MPVASFRSYTPSAKFRPRFRCNSENVNLADGFAFRLRVAMPNKKSFAGVRSKIRRALRKGMSPIEIARRLHLPLLVIAEVIAWEAALRQAGGQLDV